MSFFRLWCIIARLLWLNGENSQSLLKNLSRGCFLSTVKTNREERCELVMWKCYFFIAVVCICLHGNLSKELLPLCRNDSSHASIAFSATTYICISHLCRLWLNGLHSWFWLKQFNCVTSFKGSAVHIINKKTPGSAFDAHFYIFSTGTC